MIHVESGSAAAGRLTVRLAGEVGASSVLGIREVLSDASTSGQVVIDLTDVEFLDHAVIGVLAAAVWRSNLEGTRTRLVCPRPRLLQALREARIIETVDVVATEDELQPLHLR